ncbi:MAG: class I SAM-dependent methyltransferase [Muribaculaceae bacterium]|nr:class I SAM-dependent methyltransferase [Muribaculaceae bacterium]
MDEISFFDKLAADWDNNEILSTPKKVEEILNFMDIKPGMSILDLGTGTGVLIPYIADKIGETGRICAVDYSKEMLKRAMQKFGKVKPTPEFRQLDFENDHIEGEYDRIILYSVFPHLHSPIETLQWLKKVNLKEGGLIFIAFPTGPDFINNIHQERHSDSEILPNATDLALYLKENGLNARAIVDTEQAYVVEVL